MTDAQDLVEQLVRAALSDNAGVIDLYAPGAVHDLPFGPAGTPIAMTYEQMTVALAASANTPPRFVAERLEALTVHETSGDTAIAEYDIRGHLASTGAPIAMIGVMTVTASDGRIVRSRNYVDPNVLATVMAG